MTVNRTTLLDLPLPVTGTESGTWGDTTNNGLTQYMDIAIAGMSNLTSANFTAGALTIETTEGTSSATNITATSAQYAGFRVTSLATNSTITVGNTGTSPARSYRLINADSTYTLTFKATGQTGVTLQPGQSATVAFNGTDYVFVGVVLGAAQTFTAAQTFRAANAIRSEAASTQDAVVVAGRAGGTSSYAATITPTTLSANRTLTIPDASGTILQSGTTVTVAQGGTGAATLTANNVILGNGTSAVQFVAPGTTGNVLTSNGTTWTSTAGTSFATPLTVVGNATAGSEIRLPEDTDNGSNYVALKAPDTLASNLTFTLPSADGTNGQTITTNGSGTLSFGTLGVAGGGTGLSTTTAYGLIAAGTTSTGNFQQVSGTGTSGQLLTSNGAGALPTWQNAPASGVSKGQSIAFALIFGL